jgi:integrase/recombinase XerD
VNACRCGRSAAAAVVVQSSRRESLPLPYIRDILGHVDLSTTEIYARASIEAKRRALEAAYTDIVTDDLPEWNQDPGLLNWLAKL